MFVSFLIFFLILNLNCLKVYANDIDSDRFLFKKKPNNFINAIQDQGSPEKDLSVDIQKGKIIKTNTGIESFNMTEIKLNTKYENSFDSKFKFRVDKKTDKFFNTEFYPVDIKESIFKIRGNISQLLKYNINFDAQNILKNKKNKPVLSEAYISTKIFPGHRMFLGKGRIFSGTTNSPFSGFMKSNENKIFLQNQGNFENIGVKLGGNFSLIDYYIGAYNYNHPNNSNNIASGGWAILKRKGQNVYLLHV